jgi:hypothetical protein
MTPMRSALLYSQVVPCDICNTQLSIIALREDSSSTRNAFMVPCPICFKKTEVVIPLGIVVSSVELIGYTRPVEKATARTHA